MSMKHYVCQNQSPWSTSNRHMYQSINHQPADILFAFNRLPLNKTDHFKFISDSCSELLRFCVLTTINTFTFIIWEIELNIGWGKLFVKPFLEMFQYCRIQECDQVLNIEHFWTIFWDNLNSFYLQFYISTYEKLINHHDIMLYY